ncbi:transposase, partial [Streptomyces sp. H27-H1]|uniref:transposase n=1 Tax=Streptomyces sp. H27-H1 TaxID=2996461 RepID=UPI003B63FC52
MLGPVWSPDHEFGRSPARGGPVLIGHQSWREAISQWTLIEPHLPIAAVGPIPDLRKHFNAVMWRFRVGSPWRDLPQ